MAFGAVEPTKVRVEGDENRHCTGSLLLEALSYAVLQYRLHRPAARVVGSIGGMTDRESNRESN